LKVALATKIKARRGFRGIGRCDREKSRERVFDCRSIVVVVVIRHGRENSR
jgi:hypothetical protein